MTTTGAQTRTFTTEIEGKTLEIGLGRLAQSAAASCTIRYGDTVLLMTVCEGDPRPGLDFFPLTVDYEERMYAIGKVPGSFFRREGRPGTDATLTARMTDRPIRPLFPKGFKREVEIAALLIASDRENPADPLATTAASVCLNISKLPFEGPVSTVRVGRVDGKFKAFPTYAELKESDLELTVAATEDSIVMIEAGANQMPEAELIEAIEYAEKICQQLNRLQREIIPEFQQPKMEWTKPEVDHTLEDRISQHLSARGQEMLDAVQGEGFRGIDDMGKRVYSELVVNEPGIDEKAVRAATEVVLKAHVRARVLNDDVRADGRNSTQIRQITADVGVLPRVHGSGLFQRGQTQVLSVATLGAIRDRAKLDNIDPQEWKMYMHHYNFPAFSVGEARGLRGPGRREIGHGMLAEKAILPVLPKFEDFPYTLRVVSDVLQSNGSTSQGAVCGSTLALMDAGVPIKAPVAGIAMGLVTSDENATSYKILTDIAGIEDAFGDMDFKVAGTETGVTAVQLDIKLKKLPADFLVQVFSRAREARMHIMGVMLEALPAPREEVGEFAPKITSIKIDPSKIGAVIGPGGRVINAIIAATGASIDVEEDGSIFVGGSNAEGVKQAIRQIQGLTKEILPGEVFEGSVSRIMSFGAFVEILPGKDGMVHISELAEGRVERVEDVVNVGDRVKVKVIEVDNLGRINLSMRDVDNEGSVGMSDDDAARGDDRPRSGGGDRGGRGGGGGGGRY
ncbi:MAG: polyribonucleotide nucleotidyltransferase [Chloroflexi bacterium]|nr:MAG: polyribonucleotide nucleotidyltransferase [Chloroflexota bacterium]